MILILELLTVTSLEESEVRDRNDVLANIISMNSYLSKHEKQSVT